MATRYLTALDYSDLHATAVLRKHAKKRPLGQLESRYQYTPPQPVLSCRTVDIDVSGTRTYRPRSTADILDEQQKLIRRLFTVSGRSAASAPPRRSSPRKGLGQVVNGRTTTPTPSTTPTPIPGPAIVGKGKSAVLVQGRPCTSMSQNSEPVTLRHKTQSSAQRPKTTGRLKNVKPATDTFLANDYDEDELLETRRSHSELTNQIHAHWRPESSNLNQGHFRRGQKRPDDVPPTLDAWLTFGGTAGEESGGVVDAFANFQSPEDYYNIEGSVGSRVAEQLQKGDKIRIGINGQVFSHDLKLKKGVKADPYSPGRGEEGQMEELLKEDEEEEPDIAGGSSGDTPMEKLSSGTDAEEDLFGEIMFESLDKVVENNQGRESADSRRGHKTTVPPLDLPLSWEDQVSRPEVKVIHARPTPRGSAKENLCETHPVVFNRVVRSTAQRPRLASTMAASSNNYSLKQRTLPPSSSSSNRPDPRGGDSPAGSKVKTLTFNPNSAEDEQRLSSLSVDDVIQKRLEKTSPGPRTQSGSTKDQSEDPADRRQKAGQSKRVEKNGKRSVSAVSKTSSKSSGDSTGFLEGRCGKTPSTTSTSTSGRPLVVPRPSSSMPVRGARDKDLGIVTPSASLGRRTEPQGSEKQTRHLTALPLYRGMGTSVNSINAGPIPGDTEFIQISQPIRNPHHSLAPSSSSVPNGTRPVYTPHPAAFHSDASTPVPPALSPARSITPDNGLGGPSGAGTPRTMTPNPQRSLAPSPNPTRELPDGLDPPTSPDLNAGGAVPEEGSRNVLTPVSDSSPSPVPVRAISIPTGDRLEDEDEEELTVAQRRERSLRDQHIQQITNMLEGAILSGDHQ